MSTRAVVYFHKKGEEENNMKYTMKLYHHWDGYLEYLWDNLNKIFMNFKKTYESNNCWSMRELFKAIWDEDGFEMTCWYHSDTEYVYHVYFEDERDLIKGDKKFNFKIYYQRDGDYEGIWDDPKHLYSDNWEINPRLI